MPSTVDVVIVAYNRFDLTESCLRHLAAQTREIDGRHGARPRPACVDPRVLRG